MFFSSHHWIYKIALKPIPGFALMAAGMTVGLSACVAPQQSSFANLEPQAVVKEAPEYQDGRNKSGFASYLIAREAVRDNDIARAADEFSLTLANNPTNIKLMRVAFSTHYINGDIDQAALLASQIEQRGELVTFGSEPALILAMETHDYDGMLVLADHLHADDLSRPLGIIAGAWALILQGQGDAGLTRLLELKTPEAKMAPYAVFSQSAFMNEYLGRPEDAAAAALMAIDHPEVNIAVIMNMAGVLARQGYTEQAHDILDEKLNQLFNKDKIRADILAGTSSIYQRPTINDLLAEAIVEATFIMRDASISTSARLFLAERLAPENDRVNYALGLYFQDLENFDKATSYFNRIKTESLWHQPKQFIIARQLSFDDHSQKVAKSIFETLIKNNPSSETVWRQSADAARRRGDLETALGYYEQALALNPDRARLYYSKAIIHDELGHKSETEEALRRAVSLNPEDSYALNYLGYWLLEEGGDPNEALGYIRKAIEKKPQNGYFMDSLGWGFYKLGQYRQAVLYLERAVNLEPVDPIITDHLGDAYAKMGRMREAYYQWERALLFEPESDLRLQILEKLKHGLVDKGTE